MFIKHGDGKIVGVLDPEELTDEQKKSVKSATKTKQDETAETDTSSTTKKSGR